MLSLVSWVSDLRSQDLGPAWVLGPGSRVSSPGFRVPGLGSQVRDPGSRVLGPGSQVPGLGSQVLGPYFRLCHEFLDFKEIIFTGINLHEWKKGSFCWYLMNLLGIYFPKFKFENWKLKIEKDVNTIASHKNLVEWYFFFRKGNIQSFNNRSLNLPEWPS